MPGPAATLQATREFITLKGSTAIVSEFFNYAVNSILYQRGVYPEDDFSRVKKYGLSMMLCKNEQVNEYLRQVLAQISEWLLTGSLQKLVMVVAHVDSKEVVERWVFNIETDQEAVTKGSTKSKADKEIMSEIAAIIRQITASVTFLPILEEACAFDLLAYTAADSRVPEKWEQSDARLIVNSQEVKLRSFNTKVHQVDAMVAFKYDEEDE